VQTVTNNVSLTLQSPTAIAGRNLQYALDTTAAYSNVYSSGNGQLVGLDVPVSNTALTAYLDSLTLARFTTVQPVIEIDFSNGTRIYATVSHLGWNDVYGGVRVNDLYLKWGNDPSTDPDAIAFDSVLASSSPVMVRFYE
jgi:hypothetical protein